MTDPLVEDIGNALATRGNALGAVLGTDILEMASLRAYTRAPVLAAALRDRDPDTAVDLMHALIGDGDVPESWWGTRLGAHLAAALGRPVSAQTAARALGVSRARVYALLGEGKLTRGGDGVDARTVVARMT